MSLPARLWNLRRERPYLVGLSVLTLAAVFVWPLVDVALIRPPKSVNSTPFAYYDYGVYGGTVERWLDGKSIYVQAPNGGYRGSYLYPPVTVLFFYPFNVFYTDFKVAGTMLGVVSVIVLWVGLELAARQFGYEFAVWERFLLLLFLFSFQPALFDFKMGQIGTFLAGMLALAFYAHERHRETGSRFYGYLSGALTTVGSGFKLFYATSGAHLLRDRRRLAGAFGAAGALVALSLAIFGIDAHLTYLDVLTWGKGWGEPAKDPRLWGPAYYRPLYVLGGFAVYVRLLGILAVIGLTLAARDAPVGRETFALGTAVIPLFPPEAYTQDLVVLLVPALVLLGTELEREGGLPAIPVLAVLLTHLHAYGLRFLTHPPEWLPLHDVIPAQAGWLQPGMWATFLLVGLAATRVAQHATLPAGATQRVDAVRGD